jgi:hypothetical protein
LPAVLSGVLAENGGRIEVPRICTICSHPDRAAIDATVAAGAGSIRAIARQYRVTHDSLRRHNAEHLAVKLQKAVARRDRVEGDSLLDRLHQVTVETQAVLAEAKATKDHDLMLRCLVRLERQLELEGRMLGELKEQVQGDSVQVTVVYVDKAVIMSGSTLQAKNDRTKNLNANFA